MGGLLIINPIPHGMCCVHNFRGKGGRSLPLRVDFSVGGGDLLQQKITLESSTEVQITPLSLLKNNPFYLN